MFGVLLLFLFACCFTTLLLSLVAKQFWSPYLDKAQQPHEQRYPFLSACDVQFLVCPNNGIRPPMFLGCLTCAQVLMPAIAQGSCTDTVRESALRVDSRRKIPCRTGDSNPRQHCVWLFSRTHYQLSGCPRYTEASL